MIKRGECLGVLKKMKAENISSLITDPPAGISFMGKSWDDDKGGRDQWISWLTEVMKECLRVMKPGAHGLVWALPRTSHWTATALENAGFEVRDVVTHLFGSGFPKSHDISKGIDKAAGAERASADTTQIDGQRIIAQTVHSSCNKCGKRKFSGNPCKCPDLSKLAITDSAKQWQGWGTALKPASEHWILIRKPCSEKTVAKNILKHGVGGINIDGSRIGNDQRSYSLNGNIKGGNFGNNSNQPASELDHVTVSGRFPANLVFSCSPYCTDTQCDIECAIKMLDEQSGNCKSTGLYNASKVGTTKPSGNILFTQGKRDNKYAGQHGGASRFFYCAKASKADKNAGLEGMAEKEKNRHWAQSEGRKDAGKQVSSFKQANTHPTVKSTKLMQYLIKLITPPGGIVLDPFMGSGSTGVAAKTLGFKFIGIEKEKEYFEIAKRRIAVEISA